MHVPLSIADVNEIQSSSRICPIVTDMLVPPSMASDASRRSVAKERSAARLRLA
jgi:hypothetical protein